jgi:hypothetical protein
MHPNFPGECQHGEPVIMMTEVLKMETSPGLKLTCAEEAFVINIPERRYASVTPFTFDDNQYNLKIGELANPNKNVALIVQQQGHTSLALYDGHEYIIEMMHPEEGKRILYLRPLNKRGRFRIPSLNKAWLSSHVDKALSKL